MIKKLAIVTLTLSGGSAFAHNRLPKGVPSHAAVQSAIAKVAEIDGHVANLVAISNGGNSTNEGLKENDGFARNILLSISKKTERVLDKLDQFDALIVSGQYVQAIALKTEVCSSLDAIAYDNKNAGIAADLPKIGHLTSSLPDFADIDQVIVDTKSTVLCP